MYDTTLRMDELSPQYNTWGLLQSCQQLHSTLTDDHGVQEAQTAGHIAAATETKDSEEILLATKL